MSIRKAADAWRLLHGVVCLYKPRDMSIKSLYRQLANNLCADLNALDQAPMKLIERDIVQPHPVTQSLLVVGRKTQLDYSTHPLVVGDPYRPEDIEISALHESDTETCGVCVVGINAGVEKLEKIREQRLINSYVIDGQLGRETYKHKEEGKVTKRATFDHVTPFQMRKILARHESHFRRSAFEYAGADAQSQEAYELASRGPPRPQMDSPAIIYSIELLRFAAPYFSLEVQTVGETDAYLRAYVQELGLNLRTTACCKKLRRLRQANFTIDYALLAKHWTLQHLLDNMALCARVLNNTKSSTIVRTSESPSSTSITADDELVERMESDSTEDDLDVRLIEGNSESATETSERRTTRSVNSDSNNNTVDCLNVPWGRDY
uniref:Pseudouridine synthase II N-terminal domain-containing protein n=1 Tax=Plectus sambesii TaxID=2011161 RepID=A0A914X795_9BILA